MRLTRAGIVALTAVPVLGLMGWLFGQPEMTIASVAVAVGLLGCALAVRNGRPRLEVRREIRPDRVTVGEPCQVRLAVRNVGPSRTAVLALRDDVGRFGEASLHLAPLPRGATRDAAYTFPTHRRGLHRVGPLTVEVEDPFGLLRRRERMPDVRTVLVLPRTYPISALAPAAGDEPVHGSRVLASSSTADEEFAAMRPYTVGDDIRRIHWRTTARVGEPVVRQYDQPWQRRTTVLLDVRRDSDGDDAAFERAVSVAASVVRSARERVEIIRLVTTDGADSGFVPADERADELLDRLAAVQPEASASLAASLGLLARGPTGRLVSVVGRIETGEQRGWARGTSGYALRVLVGTGGRGPAPDPSAIVVHWDGRRPLTDAWFDAVGPSTAATALRRRPPRQVTV